MGNTEWYPGRRTASTRLEQHRRAAQGDATAQREIEARELLLAADEATSRLRDRAAEGDLQAITTLKQIANGGKFKIRIFLIGRGLEVLTSRISRRCCIIPHQIVLVHSSRSARADVLEGRGVEAFFDVHVAEREAFTNW